MKSADLSQSLAFPPVLQASPLDRPFNRALKRGLDVLLVCPALLLLAPVLGLLALAVRLDSPGPVLYRQERISRDGQPFMMLKFRTMSVQAEQQSGPVWARPDDPRTTRLGALLRRASLDELPQLLNILGGSMSLVGPRPERPHFVARFSADIPGYSARHRAKTGLTGWAQIHGLRGDTSIEARVQHDLYYLAHWSLWLDLRIIAATLLTVIRDFAHKRAY